MIQALEQMPDAGPLGDILAEHAEEIRKLGRRMVADAIEIGRRLRECRERLPRGDWLRWLSREFGWSEWTARNFINVCCLAQARSGNFPATLGLSALYLLARKSTPGRAIDEVMRLAEAGVVPVAQVKAIIQEAGDTEGESAAQAGAHVSGLPSVGTRTSARATEQYINAFYGDFGKLPHVERTKIVEQGLEGFDQRVADATAIQRWKPAHRELHHALEGVENFAERLASSIVADIPDGHRIAVSARLGLAVERFKDIKSLLDARIRRDGSEDSANACSGARSHAPRRNVRPLSRAAVISAADRAENNSETAAQPQGASAAQNRPSKPS